MNSKETELMKDRENDDNEAENDFMLLRIMKLRMISCCVMNEMLSHYIGFSSVNTIILLQKKKQRKKKHRNPDFSILLQENSNSIYLTSLWGNKNSI